MSNLSIFQDLQENTKKMTAEIKNAGKSYASKTFQHFQGVFPPPPGSIFLPGQQLEHMKFRGTVNLQGLSK